MWVDEIAKLYRQYVSEPKNSFVSDADVAQSLKLAHNLLRAEISTWRPKLIATRVTLPIAGDSYDLADPANAVRLMGSSPTNDPLMTIVSLWSQNAAGAPQTLFRASGHDPQLWGAAGPWPSYNFEGSVLRFSSSWTANFTLTYVAYLNSVDWTKQTPGDNEFVDDLPAFHDLIALKAAQQFMIRDGSVNQALMMEYERRKMDFDAFLTTAGDMDENRGVLPQAKTLWEY